jgi:hypothetical protein
MDERLKKALDFSNYMITLNNQKRLLKEQYQQNLIHYFNGGQFTISQQLISFCTSLLNLGQTSTILVDDNDMPVEIEDLQSFTDDILDAYWNAANKYLSEYQNIKKNRSVSGLVEHD